MHNILHVQSLFDIGHHPDKAKKKNFKFFFKWSPTIKLNINIININKPQHKQRTYFNCSSMNFRKHLSQQETLFERVTRWMLYFFVSKRHFLIPSLIEDAKGGCFSIVGFASKHTTERLLTAENTDRYPRPKKEMIFFFFEVIIAPFSVSIYLSDWYQ